jgi:hypothetical protein
MMHPVFKFENHLIVHSKYDNVTKTAYNLFGSVLLCRLRVPSPHQLASSNIRNFLSGCVCVWLLELLTSVDHSESVKLCLVMQKMV